MRSRAWGSKEISVGLYVPLLGYPHVATSNAGVVSGAGAANGGCCHANFHLWARVYHYFRLWRTTSVWVHLYRGDREKPVTRLSSACSQAKLGLDLQAWIGGLLKGQPPTPGPKTLACGHAAP